MYNDLSISCNSTIMEAMKIMDKRRMKLLMVVDNNEDYLGLLSIGDLQRAIINNASMETSVSKIIKESPLVSFTDEDEESIKERMKYIRAEFMPILDRNSGALIEVLFWDDVFSRHVPKTQERLNCPVVLMAGGKGTRLKPISNIIPKPLIPIGEKTMIEEIIGRFRDAGCSDFYLSVNYKKEMIEYYLNSIGNYETVKYFIEQKPLGTAGSLNLLKGKIHSTFFVSNCDILIDQDFHEVYEYHRTNNNEITLIAALRHFKIPYGILESGKDGLLEHMQEKPELTFKINAGVYILEPHLLNEIPENSFFHITDLIEKVRGRNGRVGVFPVSEKSWVDVGEWPEYIKTVRDYSDETNFQGL